MSAHKLSCLVAVVLALALAPRLSAQEPPEVERTITLLLYGPSGRATDQALRQLLEAARLATKGQLALEAGEGHYLSFQLNSAQLGEPGTTMRLVSAGVPSLSLDARKELLREASALLFIPSEEHKPGQEESALDRRSFDRLRELVSEVADGNGTKPVAIQPRSNVSCALDADTPCFTDRSEGMAAVSWAMTAAVDQEPPPPDVPNAPDLVPMRYPEPPNGLSGAASQRLLAAQRTLQASPFAQQRDDLLPAVWITPMSTSNQRGRSLPVGTSHFGGSPDVPPSFKWPEQDGAPLSFLAQIRLSDVRDLDDSGLLPDRGWLLFFYASESSGDPSSSEGWKVVWAEVGTEALKQATRPGTPEAMPVPTTPVVFRPAYTLPTTLPEVAEIPENGPEPGELYQRLRDQLAGMRPTVTPTRHHLLGHPDEILSDMRGEATAGDPDSNLEDWILLLQLDSDKLGEAQWMWGDRGRLYFWISKQDLAQRRFDRVWCVLQSS